MKTSSDNQIDYQDFTDICQVCGFRVLEESKYMRDWDFIIICPCCRLRYGNWDLTYMMELSEEEFGTQKLRQLGTENYRKLRMKAWETYRKEWIDRGMPFWFTEKKPENWNPIEQLHRIGVYL